MEAYSQQQRAQNIEREAEEARKTLDAQTQHELYSLSKSFTSSAVGLAIAEGLLSLDDTVISFFDAETLPEELGENLKAMRIRDLLALLKAA